MNGCDRNLIYVDIIEDDFDLLLSNCKRQHFDISFHINRTSYHLQHRVLHFMKEHSLHSILINNEKYNFYEDDSGLDSGSSIEYSAKGKLYESLNNEQKIAVKFITNSDDFLPYLLFGPAGLLNRFNSYLRQLYANLYVFYKELVKPER